MGHRTTDPGRRELWRWTDKAAVFKRLVANLKTAGIDSGNALEMFEKGNYTDGQDASARRRFPWPGVAQVQKMLKDANLEGQIQDGSLVITAIDQPLASTAVFSRSGSWTDRLPQPARGPQTKRRRSRCSRYAL